MKNTQLRFTIAAVVMVALNLVFTAGVNADRQSKADAIAILTSGSWHFKGRHFDITKVFEPGGKMTTPGGNGKDSTAKWKVDYKQVTISYSYYEETLLLPLDPKGTKGVDGWGDEFTATLNGGGSATPVPTATPVPKGLDALQTAPATPAQASIVTVLTARKWHFDGGTWSDDRTFTPDGAVTVTNAKGIATARWQIAGSQVVMTFVDHRESLSLPLNPKASSGTDSLGHPFTAIQAPEAVVEGTAAPSSGSSFFGKASDSDIPSPTPFPTPAK